MIGVALLPATVIVSLRFGCSISWESIEQIEDEIRERVSRIFAII